MFLLDNFSAIFFDLSRDKCRSLDKLGISLATDHNVPTHFFLPVKVPVIMKLKLVT